MKVESIRIADVVVADRHRKDLGDLKVLAESISNLGLLHPITVTTANVLVAGERRLAACRDHLKWEEIPAHVVDCHPLITERDENEARKDFTTSERLALAEHIQALLTTNGHEQDYNQTADKAAKAAGLSGKSELIRLKAVKSNGTATLVKAMDEERVPKKWAEKAARSFDADLQEEFVAKVDSGVEPGEAFEEISGKKVQTYDALELPVPDDLLPTWESVELFNQIQSKLREVNHLIDKLCGMPGAKVYLTKATLRHRQESPDKPLTHSSEYVTSALRELRDSMPFASVCPYCYPKRLPDCRVCGGLGWTTKYGWSQAPEGMKAMVLKRVGR